MYLGKQGIKEELKDVGDKQIDVMVEEKYKCWKRIFGSIMITSTLDRYRSGTPEGFLVLVWEQEGEEEQVLVTANTHMVTWHDIIRCWVDQVKKKEVTGMISV